MTRRPRPQDPGGPAPVRVMGIVNVTPDSFSDGGRHLDLGAAVRHAERLVIDGADIVDVGGESTRPGADPVPADVEADRVVPVIAAIAGSGMAVSISVDTSKPDVMRAAAAAGATMINDVRALREPGAAAVAAQLGVEVCVMHMRGEPRTMQDAPHYDDVVAEVAAFLRERVDACVAAGIGRDRIIVDPGFGFGKTLAHNVELLARLDVVADIAPVLVGVSRKAMIGALTGRPLDQRDVGSAAAALLAVQRGAAIVRVHDVAATRDALAILDAVRAVPAARA